MIKTKDDIYEMMKLDNVTFQTKAGYSHPIKTNGRSKQLRIGRILFNMILPDKHPFIDEVMTKKKTSKLLTELVTLYGGEVAAETASNLNKEAFRMGTINPISFNEDSFIVPPHIQKKKDKMLSSDMDPAEFTRIVKQLGEELIEYFKSTDNPVHDIIMSGAKSNPLEFATLIIAKGSAVDIEGNPSIPSTNSVTDGFDLDEFYANGAEARSGLFTRSSGAALPGALSRDVVYSNANILLDDKDCKTKRYLDLFVTDKMAGAILGRFYLNPRTGKLKEIEEDHGLIGKTIKIRSPLHCISKKGVCPICYGKLGERLETKHVGVMCGGVINDILLNGVAMKSRHNASNVNMDVVDFRKDVIRI
jgi:DNA-directed RNA polymerase subunit beta'